MAVKLTLSYETNKEFEEAKKLLEQKILSIKIPKNQSGKYRKAYIFLKDSVGKKQ